MSRRLKIFQDCGKARSLRFQWKPFLYGVIDKKSPASLTNVLLSWMRRGPAGALHTAERTFLRRLSEKMAAIESWFHIFLREPTKTKLERPWGFFICSMKIQDESFLLLLERFFDRLRQHLHDTFKDTAMFAMHSQGPRFFLCGARLQANTRVSKYRYNSTRQFK